MKVTVEVALEFDVDENGRSVDEIVQQLARHCLDAKMDMWDLENGFHWHERSIKKVTPEIEMDMFR